MSHPEWTARTMSPCEAAWLAGIIDGEGSIGIRSKPYPGGYRYMVTSVTIPNTDVSMIARLVELTGIGRVRMRQQATAARKQMWVWHTDQRQAAGVLQQILPWLTTKQTHALLLIEMQQLRRCGKYLPGARERQLEIVAEVKRLNRPHYVNGVRITVDPAMEPRREVAATSAGETAGAHLRLNEHE